MPSSSQSKRNELSSACRRRWCGAAPFGVKRPQNSYRSGRSTSACSASQTRNAAGSVRARCTAAGGAAIRMLFFNEAINWLLLRLRVGRSG